jgi:pimeloyl-ACP methyl ester carboxylesterase
LSTIHEFHIEDHTLSAVSFNPKAQGVPVILLHGITASIYFWSPDLIAPFMEQGPCYALSLPGHYPAIFPRPYRAAALTAESIARVLTTAIRELVGDRPVMLVGHSTGGFAALTIAAHTPQIAHSVLSISGFAHGRWKGELGKYQDWVRDGSLGRLKFKLFYTAAKANYKLYRTATEIYVHDVQKVLAYPNMEHVLRTVNFPAYRKLDLQAMVVYFSRMPDIDITPLLSRVPMPTLALTGDRDPIVPPEQARVIADTVPNGAYIILEGNIGHFPFYESPKAYQDAIQGWLNQL